MVGLFVRGLADVLFLALLMALHSQRAQTVAEACPLEDHSDVGRWKEAGTKRGTCGIVCSSIVSAIFLVVVPDLVFLIFVIIFIFFLSSVRWLLSHTLDS